MVKAGDREGPIDTNVRADEMTPWRGFADDLDPRDEEVTDEEGDNDDSGQEEGHLRQVDVRRTGL